MTTADDLHRYLQLVKLRDNLRIAYQTLIGIEDTFERIGVPVNGEEIKDLQAMKRIEKRVSRLHNATTREIHRMEDTVDGVPIPSLDNRSEKALEEIRKLIEKELGTKGEGR